MNAQPRLFDPETLEPTEEALARDTGPEGDSAYSEVLFGWDPLERVVAAEPAGERLKLWVRSPEDRVEKAYRPARYWILVTRPEDAPTGADMQRLEGEGFCWMATLRGPDAYREARRWLMDKHAEQLSCAGVLRALLMASGVTLFKGMSMRDVHRMQLDIETAGLSAENPRNRILLVALRDNRGLATVLEGKEADILRNLVAIVQERDPDIIEGHNIHGFDLPYLAARFRLHGLDPALGRDGAAMEALPRRTYSIGGMDRPLTPWHIPGRHVIDTFLAVQRFDWARGSLTSYGLKEVARALGISAADRVELPRADMEELYRTDRDRVVTYALQDVEETDRLAELVTATEFYQTQMVPDGYAASAVAGTGEKINAIFVRAYLHAGRAIPKPLPTQPYEGGYTEVRRTGVLYRVVKADFESLYPSIMLAKGIAPRTDTLGVFLPALAELTRRRLDAKARARASEGHEAQYWDGLQNSFKVLINSFYGYLGAPSFNFNDPQAAAEVTRIGRELVQEVAARIEAAGGQVIEIDTDGIYFVAPEGVDGEEAEREFVARMGEGLPEGIRLAFDGRYRAMVSVKTKNYALLDYSGKKTFKGASLRSRADEPYGREFLVQAVDCMLAGDWQGLRRVYLDTIRALQEHRIPIEKLARRERVTEKAFTSVSRQRLAPLVEGMAMGDYVTFYERKNGQLGRIEDYTPGDENTRHYIDKLYKFACRLQDAIGERFDELIPRPRDGQVVMGDTLGLFDTD